MALTLRKSPAEYLTAMIEEATGAKPYPGSVGEQDLEAIPEGEPATAWRQTGAEIVETLGGSIPVSNTYSVDIIRRTIDREPGEDGEPGIEEAHEAIRVALGSRATILAAFDRPEPLYELAVRTLAVIVRA